MLFKGTSRRKPGQIEEEIKSFGGSIGGTTGLDNVTYSITVPKEHVREALELLEDMIFHPVFDSEELEKERKVILKEINLNRDDPARRIMRDLWQTAYLEHPYKFPVIGYEDLFRGLTREDLVKYHNMRYAPNNLVLTVVGDIHKDEVLSEIKSLFSRYERRRDTLVTVPREPEQNSSRQEKSFARINLGYIAMGYHTVRLSDEELYALDVLGIILGDWDGSRLNKKLVKDTGLLYTVNSFNYTPRYPGLFIIYGIGDYKNLKKAKDTILEEIRLISANGVGESELEAAKNMVLANYLDTLETTSGLAGVISYGESIVGDADFFKKYLEKVKNVDADELREVARKFLKKSNLTTSYLYPEQGSAGTGLSTRSMLSGKDLSPQEGRKKVLPNGIRLILKEDHRIPKVSLVCAFLGGIRVESEKNNGISNLTSAMLLKGTKKRKESRIKAYLESQGGQISHFSGKNSFGLSLSFLKQNTYDALDILEDVLKNPVFPEGELEKEKDKIIAAIKTERDDVYSTGFLKLRKAIFKNYPYRLRVLGEIDTIENLTVADVRNFYKKFCAPNNMVISIVGDFDSEKMPKEIEKRLANMNPAFSTTEKFLRSGKAGVNQAPLDIKVARPAPLVGITEISYDMPREQSLILFGFRGTKVNTPDRFYLQVLSSILSGENGRLYKSVRNELGLSYALGTFSVPGLDTGYMAIYVATDKEHINETKQVLYRELTKIREGAISQKEVALAKTSLIGRQKISLQTYKALAYQMALDELYGLEYDAYKTYPDIISGIKREDVINAAKKYINLRDYCIVTILGQKND